MEYLSAMSRLIHSILLGGAILATACTKDEPVFNATYQTSCRDCVVSYAVGSAQSRVDTLLGVIDAGTGDTIAENWQWNTEFKDGDNLFLRACRIRTDTAFGDIVLHISGNLIPMDATVDTSATCAEINGPAQAQ